MKKSTFSWLVQSSRKGRCLLPLLPSREERAGERRHGLSLHEEEHVFLVSPKLEKAPLSSPSPPPREERAWGRRHGLSLHGEEHVFLVSPKLEKAPLSSPSPPPEGRRGPGRGGIVSSPIRPIPPVQGSPRFPDRSGIISPNMKSTPAPEPHSSRSESAHYSWPKDQS